MTTKESDRELLTLAAKAIGQQHDDECRIIVFGEGLENNAQRLWDPLMNDGDAFRLAVKLGIVIDPRYQDTAAYRFNGAKYWLVGESNQPYRSIEIGDCNDIYEGMRRCIVRAAAAIGKEK